MYRLPTIIIPCSILLLVMSSLVYATRGPSSGAKDMPGAVGTFEYKPVDWLEGQTTWWKHSDGINPGELGCHIGTDDKGEPYFKS